MSSDRPAGLASRVTAALGQLARAQRATRRSAAARHGLTPLQAELLAVLADGPPPGPSVGLLAAEIGVTQPTATDSLKALVSKGLVARGHDPVDRRRATIELTDAGSRLAADLAHTDDQLAAAVASLPGDVQAATLETLLTLIAELVGNGTIDIARTCLTCSFHRHDGTTHHCTLLASDLPTPDLRVNCPDHRAA